jgi:hypothetical protein
MYAPVGMHVCVCMRMYVGHLGTLLVSWSLQLTYHVFLVEHSNVTNAWWIVSSLM